MAERKQYIVARSNGAYIDVWCDAEVVERIEAIEGVTHVNGPDFSNRRSVFIDRRYDMAEIAAEIEALAAPSRKAPNFLAMIAHLENAAFEAGVARGKIEKQQGLGWYSKCEGKARTEMTEAAQALRKALT